MRTLRFILALALCVLIQTAGLEIWPYFTRAVDVFLVLTLVRALDSRPVPAMIYGMLAGWTADALAGAPFGMYGIADTLTAFIVAMAAQRLVIERTPGRVGVAAAAALLQLATLAVLARVFVISGDRPEVIWMVLKALTTGLLTALVISAGGAARRRWARAKRDRGSRLRFG